MPGLSKSMQALDEHLRRQNERQLRQDRAKEHAPLPLMPEDPLRCRWCQGRRREIIPAQACVLHASHEGPCLWAISGSAKLLEGQCDKAKPPVTVCDAGCAPNDKAPYGGACPECDRQFDTGARNALLCHPCDSAEVRETRVDQGQGRRYRYSQFRRGGYED